MDDAFGHWLAGFIDGEGCFCIASTTSGRYRICSLNVALRRDDRPLLEEIQSQTGIGKIYDSPGRPPTKPYSRWVVQTQLECQTIVELFKRYPLRGKKARDFEIWRSAVFIWAGREDMEWRLGALDTLKAQLQQGRVFA